MNLSTAISRSKKNLLILIISLGYLALNGQPCSTIILEDIRPNDAVWDASSNPWLFHQSW